MRLNRNSDIDAMVDQALSDPAELKAPKQPKRKPRRNGIKAKQEATQVLSEASGLAKMTDRPTKTVMKKSLVDSFRYFEEAVGGREKMKEVLQHCPPTNPAYKAIQRLFKDVDFSATTTAIATVCERQNVSLPYLLLAFKDSMTAKLTLQTITQLSQHVPEIVEHTASDAKNRFEDCPVCLGSARVPRIADNGEWMLDADGEHVTQLCYNCRGTGQLYSKHDPASRKLIFQLTGMLQPEKKERGDVTVQIANVRGDFMPGDGTFEKLINAIDLTVKPQAIGDGTIDSEIIEYDAEVITSEQAQNSPDPASRDAS